MSSFPGHDYTSVAKIIDLLSLAVRRWMLGTKYLSGPLSNTIDSLVFLPIVHFKVPKYFTPTSIYYSPIQKQLYIKLAVETLNLYRH